jgi:hemoglobin-like flavoprotein
MAAQAAQAEVGLHGMLVEQLMAVLGQVIKDLRAVLLVFLVALVRIMEVQVGVRVAPEQLELVIQELMAALRAVLELHHLLQEPA